MSNDRPTITVDNLAKVFQRRRMRKSEGVRAVNGVSFELHPGETIGLVGESGCGKTTLARMILGSEQPTSGRTLWHGRDLATLHRRERKDYHAAVQAVFQDPTSSLNPRMKIGSIIAEPLHIHRRGSRSEIHDRVRTLLEAVGLEPRLHANSYPHELSGGMRQRVAVARALALDPEALVLDEPVSSLDVSVRAQIMNLLKRLQEEFGFACILIAHDLASVRYMADRIVVMYLGGVVELGPANDAFSSPFHPYTRALIDSTASIVPRDGHEVTTLSGEIPSPLHAPIGCPLHGRCPHAFEPCSDKEPQLREIAPGHAVACYLFSDDTAASETSVRVTTGVGTATDLSSPESPMG